MAQQYGGFDMGMAIMEKAQGKTPEDLVKLPGTKSCWARRAMKQKWSNISRNTDAFAHSLIGEKADQILLIKTPDVAFSEFTKANVPLEVISKGDEQSLSISINRSDSGDHGSRRHGYEH